MRVIFTCGGTAAVFLFEHKSGTPAPTGCVYLGAPVFEGAPMRAVGDAGPYGVRDRRHGEIRVGGVCPLVAFKRGTRERVAFSGRL